MSNTHALKTPRGFSGKKPSGTSKAVYPPEESFNPEFIKEVEQSIQDIKDGKGIRFKSVDDLFDYLKK